MAFWNDRHLPKPSNYTVIYRRQQLKTLCFQTYKTDVKPEKWVSSLLELLQTSKSQITSTKMNVMYENNYLHAYIYQNGHLRKEKFIQAIRKVGKCLKRWQEMQHEEIFSSAIEMIPSNFFNIESIRLPSSGCMQYLLQRLVGSFYLLLQCVSYCTEAASYFRTKLLQEHFIGPVTLGIAIVARIRALTLDLANVISNANDDLHPYVMAMNEVFPFGSSVQLPHNLSQQLSDYVKGSTAGANTKTNSSSRMAKSPRRQRKRTTKKTSVDNVAVRGDQENAVNSKTDQSEEAPESVQELTTQKSFPYSVPASLNEPCDLGERVSYESFEMLRRESSNVIETPAAKKVNLEIEERHHNQVKKKRKRKRDSSTHGASLMKPSQKESIMNNSVVVSKLSEVSSLSGGGEVSKAKKPKKKRLK